MNKFLAVNVLVIAICLPVSESSAGIYDSAVKRAATRALSKPKLGAIEGAGLPMEKNVAKSAMTAAERAKYTEILTQLDRDVLASIDKRYGVFISPKKMAQSQNTPTAFLDEAAYHKALRNADPSISDAEVKEVIGHYLPSTRGTYVNRNTVVVPNVAAHERLHQLANPRFAERFGNDIDEGATGYFSLQIYGDLGLVETRGLNYPEQRRLISLMSSRVGDEAVAKAYFQGDFRALQQGLDNDLGNGAFELLSRRLTPTNGRSAELRSMDLKEAEEILRGF